MKKLLKILLVFIPLALLFNWFTSDKDEIQRLIKQGYLDADFTREDINKLCNPQNDEERKADEEPEDQDVAVAEKRHVYVSQV